MSTDQQGLTGVRLVGILLYLVGKIFNFRIEYRLERLYISQISWLKVLIRQPVYFVLGVVERCILRSLLMEDLAFYNRQRGDYK